jgi:hypothetical protein
MIDMGRPCSMHFSFWPLNNTPFSDTLYSILPQNKHICSNQELNSISFFFPVTHLPKHNHLLSVNKTIKTSTQLSLKIPFFPFPMQITP